MSTQKESPTTAAVNDENAQAAAEGEGHYKIGIELLYDLKRRVLRFITYLEIPARKAKQRLKDMDAAKGHGRHRNEGPKSGKERRGRND